MKKLISIFIVLLIVVSTCVVSVGALNFECDKQTYSDSIIMVNLDSDTTVFEKDADTKRYPASLTKIMTFIIVSEYFDDYDNTKIEIKKSVITTMQTQGITISSLDNYVGKSLSVTDLLYAMMLPMGHDAAMVFADYIKTQSGTDFVAMMNSKVQKLGLKNTHFSNSTGIHSPDHYTTARDMYKITKYAMGLPLFSKICATTRYTLPAFEDVKDLEDGFTVINTNEMIRDGEYHYTYATGIKNGGLTDQAGRCLVSTAVYDGYAYMIVCMHSPSEDEYGEPVMYTMIESADLYRWAFLNLSFVTQATKETPICEQEVQNAWDTKSILLVPEKDLNIILPKNYNDADVTIVPDSTAPVSAPIEKGQVITSATVYYKGQKVTKINLVSQEEVKVSFIIYASELVKTILTSIWFLLSVFIVIVLFVVYVTVSTSYNNKKKARSKRKYK